MNLIYRLEDPVTSCWQCGLAGDLWSRTRSNTHAGDPSKPFQCGKCSQSSRFVVVRESRASLPPRHGNGGVSTDVSLEDLEPEDLGLPARGAL